MIKPIEYTRLDYQSDVSLVRKFGALRGEHNNDPFAPWEEYARTLLRSKHMRVRTAAGNITEGKNASFSHVLSTDVTDKQAYAVLVKEVNAAMERAEKFRKANAGINRDSGLEQIANAIHIARVDRQLGRVADLTYLLGERLVAINPSELKKAKRRIGYEMVQAAYAMVKPRLFSNQ